MKFRTEIDKPQLKGRIDYNSKIVTLGSCFAENITKRLAAAKFCVKHSPVGILFNPASIASTLTAFAERSAVDCGRIVRRSEGWVSLDCHSELTMPTEEEAIKTLQNAIDEGHKLLRSATCVIITFGTAWVYEHIATGRVVANCHKQPSREFCRRRMSVEEIVTLFKPLMEGVLRDKHVIFTVSPIRHTADGLTENCVSKAILRLAADTLSSTYDNADYFPAFEIVTDDLRDYRFYAEDMVHPSAQAVEYIWQRFIESALADSAVELLPKVEKIVAAATHKPFNPNSEEYATFCKRYLTEAQRLSMIDFSAECEVFERYSK
ncbi:MAG: GSCFA domain-containing protein [Alistipes sp.]|nr:GSCFA domain-containing protein [Alistipes sp.]